MHALTIAYGALFRLLPVHPVVTQCHGSHVCIALQPDLDCAGVGGWLVLNLSPRRQGPGMQVTEIDPIHQPELLYAHPDSLSCPQLRVQKISLDF